MCIVGCGGFAKAHARALQQKADRADIYFASRTYEKAAQYADEFGALDAFGSYQAAADDPKVDSLRSVRPTRCTARTWRWRLLPVRTC